MVGWLVGWLFGWQTQLLIVCPKKRACCRLRFLCLSPAALLIKRVAIFSTPKIGILGSMDRVLIADSHATDGGKWESCDACCEDNTCVWSYRLLYCVYEVAAPAHRKNACFWPRSGTQKLIPKVCLMPLPRLSSQDSTYLKINQHVTASCCRKHACKLPCEAMHAWRAFSPCVKTEGNALKPLPLP